MLLRRALALTSPLKSFTRACHSFNNSTDGGLYPGHIDTSSFQKILLAGGSAVSSPLKSFTRACHSSNNPTDGGLYPGHIDTSSFQKILLAGGSAVTALSSSPLKSFTRTCHSSSNPTDGGLYPGHIDTFSFQKILLAGGSAVTALSNPWRADMVAVNGEVTGTPALRYMLGRFNETQEGQKILATKPRITKETLDSLANHPADSLGGTYYAFMTKYNLNPDARDKVQFVDDPQLAYVMTRYRETHDLTHAVLEMPTNILGEVLVKWVEAIQTRLPMCISGAIFGPLRFRPKQRDKYSEVLPWAISVGTKAKFLPGVYYEQRWDQKIDDFRAEMRIPDIPKLLK